MFPEFNIHSSPLLILVIQGLIFAILLFLRYRRTNKSADLIIVLILLTMAYQRITYTIGFMGWYDTFKNTKINYYLLPMGLAMGPLIYLYLRTTLRVPFKLRRIDIWHFIPIIIYIGYRFVLWAHDIQQEGWDTGYEGEWMQDLHVPYITPIYTLVEYTSQLLYMALSIQLFWHYRTKIRHYFSNSYKVELNWIVHFLSIYIFLFVYSTC